MDYSGDTHAFEILVSVSSIDDADIFYHIFFKSGVPPSICLISVRANF